MLVLSAALCLDPSSAIAQEREEETRPGDVATLSDLAAVDDPAPASEAGRSAPAEDPAEEAAARHDLPPDLRGRGLLDLLDPFPLAVLHLQLPVNTILNLDAGQFRLLTSFNWANNFAKEREFTVDAETYRLEIGAWYALQSDFYVGVGVPFLARDSGVLDGLVNGFHDVFGLGAGGRDSRPRNDYEIVVREPNGDEHRLDRGMGLGDILLKAHWNLFPGEGWLPAARLDILVGLPTSTPIGFGSHGLDLGAALSFSKTFFEDLHAHAVFGATYLVDPSVQNIRYERRVYQATGGLEYELTKRLSLVFQASVLSPLLETPSPLDESRNYLAGGLKWEIARGFVLDLSLAENLAPFQNSADIAFTFAFSARL